MFIDPWASQQFKDYQKLKEEFNIEDFKFDLPDPPPLFRRGIVFGHRGFQYVYRAIVSKKNFAVLTGLMPSGKMHLGHKMVLDQIIYFQRLGGDVHIASADIEAYHTRGISLTESHNITLEEYARFYLAMGLDAETAEVYFQSKRDDVKSLAILLSKKITLNDLLSRYGFSMETSYGHTLCPLIQIGDILHVQLDKYGGPRPTVVPVGIDQEPHIRLARDIARKWRIYSFKEVDGRIGIFLKGIEQEVEKYLSALEKKLNCRLELNINYRAAYTEKIIDEIELDHTLAILEKELGFYGFIPPSSTYHRLITGLDGNKMSSSRPSSAIFLSDDPDIASKKVLSALTGGRKTVEDQKKYGGNPAECSVYELFTYHLVEDDKENREIYDECRGGIRLCGKCKKEASEKIKMLLSEIQKNAKNIESKDLNRLVKTF